jgi:hypothetical protein
MYPSLRHDLSDAGYGCVDLNNGVHQIKVPNDLKTQVGKRGPEREKVDDGFHAKLLLFTCVWTAVIAQSASNVV